MTDVPVHFRDYDPTINPTNNIIPYDATQPTADIAPRASLSEERSDHRPKNAIVPEAIIKAMDEYARLIKHARRLENEYARYQAQYLQIIEREAHLAALKAQVETPVAAWCADLTTDIPIDWTVGTLEISGEVDPKIGGGVNIRPGYNNKGGWLESDGLVQLGPALTPEGFAWNLAMLNPWMKWMPKWRYGTVTAVNTGANTVNVTLDAIVSKAGSYLAKISTFNDPWDSSMSGVDVDYMTCGAAAFEINDDVIVEFRLEGGGGLEYYTPYVIGFKDNPKACSGFICTGTDGYYLVRNNRAVKLSAAPQAGNVDWQGEYGVLSWRGPYCRYSYLTFFSINYLYYPYLYKDNTYLATTPSEVLGAGITVYSGQQYVNLICAEGFYATAYQANLSVLPLSWNSLGSINLYEPPPPRPPSNASNYWGPWFFNASGNQGRTIYAYDKNNDLRRIVQVVFNEGSANFAMGASGNYFAVDWQGDTEVTLTRNNGDLSYALSGVGTIATDAEPLFADIRYPVMLYADHSSQLALAPEYYVYNGTTSSVSAPTSGAIASISGGSIVSSPKEYIMTFEIGSTAIVVKNISDVKALLGLGATQSPHEVRIV